MPPPSPRPSSARDLAIAVIALVWLIAFGGHFLAQPFEPSLAIDRIDVLADAGWLLMDNIWPPPDEQASNSGWRYFPQRFDLLVVAGAMLLAAWSAGRLLLRALRIEPTGAAERVVYAFGLGLSAWTLATLGLGLAGALWRWPFVALMLVVICAELALRIRQRRAVADERKKRRERIAERRYLVGSPLPIAVCLGVAPFLLAMLLGSMLPTTDFDAKEYHLQGPKEWYQQGRITFLPHNVYTSFPFLTEMLALWGMVLRGDWYRGALIGKVLMMAFGPLTAAAVYGIVRRVSSTAGWLAVFVFLTIPWIYRISIIAGAESGLTFFLAAACLGCVDRPRDVSTAMIDRQHLLCGLLAGSALACKYPGLVSVTIPLGAAVVLLAARGNGTTDVKAALRAAVAFSLGVAVTFGPWALKNLVETGNPVYPLAYSVFGGHDWTPELNQKWKKAHGAKVNWSDPAGIPLDLWLQAEDIAVKTPLQSPLVFGLAPLALLVLLPRRRSEEHETDGSVRATRRLTAALVVYCGWLFLTWWGLTHRIDRFWLPMLPIVCALAGIGGGRLAEQVHRLFHAGRRYAALVCGLGFAGVAILATAYNLVVATSAKAGLNTYLMDETAVRKLAIEQTPSIALLQSRLPAGARVLLVGEAAVFDARFDLRYNTVFDFELLQAWATDDPLSLYKEDIPLKSRDEILKALHDHGITHVFVNWLEILRYREYRSYTYTDFISPRTMRKLVELGVLEPVKLAPQERLVLYEGLDSPKKQELDAWAPELKSTYAGEPVVEAFELYTVASP